jgi:hypothetical protein
MRAGRGYYQLMFGRTRTIGLGLDARARAAGQLRQPRQPFADFEALARRQASLRTGLASLVLHVLVIGLVIWLTRAERASEAYSLHHPAAPRAVTMLYVPPKPQPRKPTPQQLQPPPPPSPAPVQPAPAPAPKTPLPVATVTRNAPEHDEPAATAPEPSSRHETASKAEAEDPMVTEARRIFGRKEIGPGGATGGPLRAGRPVQTVIAGGRCPWGGAAAADAEGPATGVVEGVVRSESSGTPVPGALLQLLGTGSATFSDDAGHYRLNFDPSLVDRCRSQIVRVTAPGYRARNMVLAYGSWSDNTVDMAGR